MNTNIKAHVIQLSYKVFELLYILSISNLNNESKLC